MSSAELKFTRTVLLVENDPVLRKLLSQNLELYTASKVIYKRDADDLIDYLKRHEELPDLIISEDMVGDEYTILKVYYYVNSQKLDIPIILLGENKKVEEQVTQIDRSNWTSVIKNAARLMQVTAEDMMKVIVPQYYPINASIFLGGMKAPVDLYRLEEDSVEKTVWFKKGDEIKQQALEDFLLNDKNQFVYVLEEERLRFAEIISEFLQVRLLQENQCEKLVTLAGESFKSAAALLSEQGLREEGIRAAQATIDAMTKIAQSAPGLDDLLAILLKDNSSLVWQHSLMTAVVSHALLEGIDWANHEQKGKLVFVSFYHDICIADDRFADIHSNGELYSANLTPEERVKVERHALSACELLQSHPDVPFGAEGIILQHHGVPNGIGFSQEHLDNRITPLAMLFRVAEDYVHLVLSQKRKDSFYIFKELEQRYNKGHYKKAVEALKKCHSENAA